MEHRTAKGRYRRTDRNTFVRQLTQIERREARLRRIKQRHQAGVPRTDAHEIANDPKLHHHIGQSEKIYDEFGQYLRNHTGDPAMKVSNLFDVMVIILRCYAGFPTQIKRTHSYSPRAEYRRIAWGEISSFRPAQINFLQA